MIRFATIALSLSLAVAACGQRPEPTGTVAKPAAMATAEPLKVVNFNQKSTNAGKIFNVQRDGNSGITFELNQPLPPADVRAWFDNKPLTGVVANGVLVTTTIPGEYLQTPGEYLVELEVSTEKARLPAGMFTVKAP